MSHWHWHYHDYQPAQERLREALCTLGNGYFATRGAAPESEASEHHYPGTYLAGGYDRAESEVRGRVVENEDLVNLPNWLPLRIIFDDGSRFDPDEVEILAYRQTLDMRLGILERDVRFRDASGRTTALRQRRLVHMALHHLAALETEITALDWSGGVTVQSALDGRIVNAGVERYQGLTSRHLEPLTTDSIGEDGILLEVRTRQSRLKIALAARTRLYRENQRLDTEPALAKDDAQIGQSFALRLKAGRPVVIEKLVALYTSRDAAISECGLAAREAIIAAPRFEQLLAGSALIWQQMWQRFDLELQLANDDDGGRAAAILHLHLFHLLVTAGPQVMDLDVGVPARAEPGLDNHAYTTVMAAWVLCRALELPQHLPRERWDELVEQLRITNDELAHWDRVSRRLRVCFHGDGIISQFEGFAELKELDWEDYRARYGDIQRLDRILEAEGDSPNRYQATKQADVLMLFYLFSAEEVVRLFERLGYAFDPDLIPRNVAYYESRTSHGSTLSRVVNAWVLARSDRRRSWQLFAEAIESDVADIQGGTTSEGIHLGAIAGTVDLMQRC